MQYVLCGGNTTDTRAYTHAYSCYDITCVCVCVCVLGPKSASRLSRVACIPKLSAGVLALAAGGHHTCALLMGGGAVCWGDNERGQLGTGNATNKLTPTAVKGLETGEGYT
jgi:hypothetical protein